MCETLTTIQSAAFVLDSTPRNARLDRLRRAVSEAGPNGVSREAVNKLFSGKLRSDELDELAAMLCQDGDYEQRQIPTGGRPTSVLARRVK